MVRVLFSDDDPLVVSALTRLASQLDMEVVPDLHGQVLALAEELRPDVIVLDVHQRGVDGRDLLARLKDDPATMEIEVVVVSGKPQSHTRAECLALGAVGFVEKPLGKEFLLELRQLVTNTGDSSLPSWAVCFDCASARARRRP